MVCWGLAWASVAPSEGGLGVGTLSHSLGVCFGCSVMGRGAEVVVVVVWEGKGPAISM